MPDTYGSVLDANGLPKATAPGEVRAGPWRVDLTVPNCDPEASYEWSVDGVPIAPTRAGCTFSSDAFPRLGEYTVEVRAGIGGQQLEGREKITVEDWLIVSLGDSVASGEGVPERPRSGFEPARWEDKRCHRSAYAGPAVAARRLAERSSRISITFVRLACSGATISSGLLGGYGGITGGSGLPLLPPQVTVLDEIAERREPHAVLISIGANDVGFSDVVISCATHRHRGSCFRGPLGDEVTSRLKALPGLYAQLGECLKGLSSRAYLTEYFDPTGNASGQACESVLKPPPIFGLGLFGLNHEDLQDARAKLLSPLNQALAEAAARYHWTEVTGIAEAFRDHGYCAGPERWITTLPDSILQQGSLHEPKASVVGTLHPNREGQQQIAARIQAALEKSAERSCAPPAGATDPPPALSATGAGTACWVPQAVDLPLLPLASAHNLSAPLWILIALSTVALGLLLVLALARSASRVRELVPALLAALLGAGLVDLGVELVDHTAPAVVLMAGGAFALATAPLLLRQTSPRSAFAIAWPRRRSARGGARFRWLMESKGLSTTNLVVVCLGAALVVFFAGVTASVAAGQTPPTALWAAGGAVSGALIGLLTPAPGSKKSHEAAAAFAENTAKDARSAAAGHARDAAAAAAGAGGAHEALAKAETTAAEKASAEAVAHRATAATTPETGIATALLFVVFVVTLALGVFLAAGGVVPPSSFTDSLKSVTTAVIALASASGSALIGILAPSPSKGS
ncbi:MAG: SGNH/GDSL hydrolase family protein [Solirubrobacteraceae bacterium]